MICRHPYSKLHWITSNKAVIFKIAVRRDSSFSLALTSYKIYTCSVYMCAEDYIKISNCHTKQWPNTHFVLGNISKRGESQAFADHTARGKPWNRGSTQTYRKITILFGPFGVDFVRLTEGNIPTSSCTNAKYSIDHDRLSTLLNQNVRRSKVSLNS